MKERTKAGALYICYFGVREPLVQTQVLPYLRKIVEGGVRMSLLTFEPDRPAAWANISRHTLIGIALGTLALLRLPFRVVLPVAVAVAVIGFLLRPRGKKRPQSRGPRDKAAMQPQPSEVIRTAEPDVARRQ